MLIQVDLPFISRTRCHFLRHFLFPFFNTWAWWWKWSDGEVFTATWYKIATILPNSPGKCSSMEQLKQKLKSHRRDLKTVLGKLGNTSFFVWDSFWMFSSRRTSLEFVLPNTLDLTEDITSKILMGTQFVAQVHNPNATMRTVWKGWIILI